MTKFKKIIPALCMLLISAVLMGTSTYAWFSMNTTVGVTGMQVTANSDATYLLVSNANTSTTAPTAANIQAENGGKGFTTVEFNAAAKSVLPVALGTVGADPDYTVTAITPGTNVKDFSWYTMNGKDASDYTGAEKSARQVSADNLGNYVLSYTLYFTVAAGANTATNLHVTACTITGDAALRCLVVGSKNSVQFSATDADGDTTVLAETLTDKTVVSVTVYVYYDGNATSIFTNNKAQIAAGNIGLTFGVTAA